ncbi:hypothetical protein M6B38_203815 [Iris pallida]|uniref:Uncharacterized protein n=1 Tax=Iris pallida TaxID=29817 RepID=A0AAX6E7X1_IRIPA|nr:hypothetical protein M6B38_203815 [Iris pallida]
MPPIERSISNRRTSIFRINYGIDRNLWSLNKHWT